MTSLKIESIELPSASVGAASSLPPLRSTDEFINPELDVAKAESVLGCSLAYGRVANILPYTWQGSYDRVRSPRTTTVAVLENDLLRAVFLLEAGGRLWSLTQRPSGRDLLYTNPVFQPANVGMRGAWFAGGVEWSIGAAGHSAFTASPVHAAAMTFSDGSPMLRLYEWERIRAVAVQIDILLPEASSVLIVVPRIRNQHDRELPMWSWSNIAVREGDDVRVLVPATSAYLVDQDHQIDVVPVPGIGASPTVATDCTYPARAAQLTEWFFRLDPYQRPWIAAVDGSGRGLAQVSTGRLRGRKLFSWGSRPGGRHWQDWLSGGKGSYFEIQAGLAPTQLQHLPMPAGATWSWAEAYGALDLEPTVAHGRDWTGAIDAAEKALAELVPPPQLERWAGEVDALADLKPDDELFLGSGWGALERERRKTIELTETGMPGTPFPAASLGSEEESWLALLAGRPLPDGMPRSYMTGDEWLPLLEGAPPTWLSLLHVGVARYAAGDLDRAREAWEASVQNQPNVIALRNLGVLAVLAGRPSDGIPLLRQAYHLVAAGQGADDCSVAHEVLLELLDALVIHDAASALELVDSLPRTSRQEGRVLLCEARAALAVGDPDRCRAVLAKNVEIGDVREGEITFEAVWGELSSRYPLGAADLSVPPSYDFRT